MPAMRIRQGKNARVMKKLIRAAKNAMMQLEFAPRTDGITWRHGAAWDELCNAVRAAEKIIARQVRRKF
jgi:hypothetical protein